MAGAGARGGDVTESPVGPRAFASARAGKGRLVRLARWTLALVALAVVAWVVPLRDHCWDAAAPRSTQAAVTRLEGGACVLHIRSGDIPFDAAHCAALQCEPGALSTMAHARVGVIAALLALYAAGTLAWAARWRALLGFADVDMSLRDVWRVSIQAQAGGILLPGGIGGDALRIGSVVARVPKGVDARGPLAVVAASVLLDRVVGLAVLAGLAVTLAFASGGAQAGPLFFVLAAVPVVLAVGVVLVRRAPLERWTWLVRSRLAGVTAPLLAYVRDPRAPRAILTAALLSVVVAGVQFATIRGLVFALGGAPTAEKWVYVGTAMVFVVSALPGLPGAWGTADYAYVYFLGHAGLPSGIALAVCLLYRLFWYLSAVAGAVLYLVRPRARAEATEDSAAKPQA